MKYLLCVDGSDHSMRAVERFCELAKPDTDTLTIYTSFLGASDGYFGNQSSDIFIPSERKGFHDDLQGKRRIALEALDKAKKIVEEKCGKGKMNLKALMFGVEDISQGIVEYSKKNQMDMIVLGSRGFGRITRYYEQLLYSLIGPPSIFMGSVSTYVVTNAVCTVVVVH